jgi:hypothetical protein
MTDTPYWTLDTFLFEGQFSYFGNSPVYVRGKVYQSEEKYRLRKAERDREPVHTLRGTRQYIDMRPFVSVRNVTVIESKPLWVEIGQIQAWYYPQDHLIVLWECFLHEFVREKPLLEDSNMRALWESVACFLLERFPEAARITTPSHDPLFEMKKYHKFLSALGYQQVAKAAWGKSIEEAQLPLPYFL